jgi:dCTP deaminase
MRGKCLDSIRKNEGELSERVSVLSDDNLVRLIRKGHLVIRPFEKDAITCKGIDLRLGNEIARINHTKLIFDSRRKNDLSVFFTKEVGSEFIIKEQETVLFHTLERLVLPADIMGIIGLRSSYTRLGLHVSLGFVDPGFKGQLTVEVTGSSFPIKVYTGDKLFHIVFVKLSSLCTNTYGGKYQNQKGVTLPIFPNKLCY